MTPAFSDYDLWKLDYYPDASAQERADDEADAALDFDSQAREFSGSGAK